MRYYDISAFPKKSTFLDIQTIRGTAAQETLEEKCEQVGCGGGGGIVGANGKRNRELRGKRKVKEKER
jgi:hypothetical protein